MLGHTLHEVHVRAIVFLFFWLFVFFSPDNCKFHVNMEKCDLNGLN